MIDEVSLAAARDAGRRYGAWLERHGVERISTRRLRMMAAQELKAENIAVQKEGHSWRPAVEAIDAFAAGVRIENIECAIEPDASPISTTVEAMRRERRRIAADRARIEREDREYGRRLERAIEARQLPRMRRRIEDDRYDEIPVVVVADSQEFLGAPNVAEPTVAIANDAMTAIFEAIGYDMSTPAPDIAEELAPAQRIDTEQPSLGLGTLRGI